MKERGPGESGEDPISLMLNKGHWLMVTGNNGFIIDSGLQVI